MIIRLSYLDEEKKSAYINYYKNILLTGQGGLAILEPTEKFDEYGLKFPIDYLKKISRTVIFFPLEIMANYADKTTVTAVSNNDAEFNYYQVVDPVFNIEEAWPDINATSIGNLAYIALHCTNIITQQNAEEILNKIFVKTKGILLNAMNEIL